MKIAIAFVLVSVGTARADGPGPLPSVLPNRCAVFANIPRSTIPDPAFAAHLSVAACIAEVSLTDATTVEQMNTAAAASIALYDDVIRTGDAYWKLVAEDGKRDLFIGMVVRLRAGAGGRDVEAQVGPWKSDADQVEVAIADLARKHPELAHHDAVIAHVFDRVAQERTATR